VADVNVWIIRSVVSVLLYASMVTAHAETAQAQSLLHERAQRLASELRCLVCQNQTIADSQADLAVQLKQEVFNQLASGATDDQVRAYMVERYGEFVLYNPPFMPATWLLWGGPLLLLGLGIGFMVLHWRERQVALKEVADSALPIAASEFSEVPDTAAVGNRHA